MVKTVVKKAEVNWDAAELFDILYETHEVISFLDSSMQNRLGNYSIIGINPYSIVKAKDEVVLHNDEVTEKSLEMVMKSILQERYEKNETMLPMISGCIGYMSYDYGMRYNGVVSRKECLYDLPDCIFVFYDNYIIFDHKNQWIYLTASGQRGENSVTAEVLQWTIAKEFKKKRDRNAATVTEGNEVRDRRTQVKVAFTAPEYGERLDRIRDHIEEGDIYVINMTQNMEIQTKKRPIEVYRDLRRISPSPYSAFLRFGEHEILCSSPEQFLKVKDGTITTRPIKGTRKRGVNPVEDAALKKELEESEKDRSELVMVTDLERNDLNRICTVGSVKVNQLFEVEAYSTVFHLVSEVEGTLDPEADLMDVLQNTFPGGSITGAPKIRSMEIIEAVERQARGIYTGTLGYLTLDRCCDMNIIIRTAIAQNDTYHLGVGGGITYESENEFEYEETLQKAKAILEATK